MMETVQMQIYWQNSLVMEFQQTYQVVEIRCMWYFHLMVFILEKVTMQKYMSQKGTAVTKWLKAKHCQHLEKVLEGRPCKTR